MRKTLPAVVIGLLTSPLFGQFATEHSITPLERTRNMLAGDVDGNGTTDMVICGEEGPIHLYRGTANGEFLPPEILALHRDVTLDESGLVDIDGDQDLDVIYHDDHEAMRLLRNDGTGYFAPPALLFPLTQDVQPGVRFRDMDGDSDVDILLSRVIYPTNQIMWYRNDGSGAFSSMGVVASSNDSGYWVEAGDVDGDGDADIITSRATNNNDILWYPNNGIGTFSPAIVAMSGSTDYIERARVADLNMDGREDICYVDGDKDIRLVLTDPNGFQPPVLLYSAAIFNLNGDLRLADMDANGSTDVVFCDNNALIGYFPNPGDGAFPTTPDTLIPNPWASIGDPFITADMDNNGLLDIVVGAPSALAYFPDEGWNTVFPPRLLSRAMSAADLLMGDLDQDGDADALSIASYGYSLHGSGLLAAKNDGTGVFARPDTISSLAMDFGFGFGPWHLHDVDEDGDPDILLLENRSGPAHLGWLVNNGSGYFDSSVVLLSGTRYYELVDLDQDGRKDLLAIREDGPGVGWSRNLGAGMFGDFIELGMTDANALTAGDPDNDGDLDVIAISGTGEWTTLGLFEDQGNAVFAPYVGIGGIPYGGAPLSTDLDGDGLEDLLITTYYNNGLFWLKNNGGSQFTYMELLIDDDLGMSPPTAIDMDEDGDPDILYTLYYFNSIFWRQNQGGGSFAPATELATVHGIPSHVHVLDVDGDGIRDLAYTLQADSLSGPYAYCPGWIGGTGAPLAVRTTDTGAATIFPVPFSQHATIRLAEPLLPGERLLLLDGTGRTVRTLRGSGSDRIALERGDLPAGLYLIQKQGTRGSAALGRVVVD